MSPRTTTGRAVLPAAVLLLALTATACTSSKASGAAASFSAASQRATAASAGAGSVTPSISVPAPSTEASNASASAAPTSTSARRSPVPSATATGSAAAPGRAAATTTSSSTCRTVTVRVIPGGALPGAEIAAMQFTNAGSTRCALGGFPVVRLLLNGTPIGAVSQSNGAAARTLQLDPGDTVESQLRDFSSCSAPLSDNARVTVPGESTSVVRPVRLRACALRVAPLGPPS